MPKWVVVGAGLTGATLAERIATERREEVLVVERNQHLAGTASDYWTPEGLLVSRYGPHLLHTNAEHVWAYLQRFATWTPAICELHAQVAGQSIPLPLGFRGIDLLFGDRAPGIKQALIERFGLGSRVPITALKREQHPDLQALAAGAYESIFQGYNLKHWGVGPEELSPSVTARVPILVGDQPSYHSDKYQAFPLGGFSQMVGRMLDNPRIRVELGTNFVAGQHPEARVIYSGAVDEYFGYRQGRLPYRSVRFETLTYNKEWVQPVACLTYPNEHLYTRTSEVKRITQQQHPRTAVTYEYPTFEGEPLYPVPSPASQAQYRSYFDFMDASGVTFCGRLGHYVYYNMDQAVGAALAIFQRLG